MASYSSVNRLFEDKVFALWAEAANRVFLLSRRLNHLAVCFIYSCLSVCFVLFFKTGSFYVDLAVLELSV